VVNTAPNTAHPDLLVEREGAVVTWVLNRPAERNALSMGMREGMLEALRDIERDPSMRVLVIRGAGSDFCAGGDVKALAAGDANTPQARLSRMRALHPLITGLAQLDRPVLAAVDGVRLCMAFQRVGLVPDFGATYTLPRAVGLQRARELVLSAREVGGPEAVQLGLALECVEPQLLHARVREIAMALAKASPVSMGLAKRALNASLGNDLATMLEMESSAQAIAATSDDARSAFEAFARKEPLAFRWPAK
jgi:2-(1,2-epoxy-1,2-dihydrophenyl)acetyl-CoA isomerase